MQPQKGTMHAFPEARGNVAVSHGWNGAGSTASASVEGMEDAGSGAGASQPRSYLQAARAAGSVNARGLDAHEFPINKAQGEIEA